MNVREDNNYIKSIIKSVLNLNLLLTLLKREREEKDESLIFRLNKSNYVCD